MTILSLLSFLFGALVLTSCGSNDGSSVAQTVPPAPGPKRGNGDPTADDFSHAAEAVRGEDVQVGKFITDSTNPKACKGLEITEKRYDDRGVPEVALKLTDCPADLIHKLYQDYDGVQDRVVCEAIGTDIHTLAGLDDLDLYLKIASQDLVFANFQWTDGLRNFGDDPQFTVIVKYRRVEHK